MPASYRARLGWILAAGLLARIAVAFATRGLTFDLGSLALVRHALLSHPLHLYSSVNSRQLDRWPYPSGYFPIVLLVGALGSAFAHAFIHVIRLPPILADLAVAWIVQGHLGRRGASERSRLIAAAAVSLGPPFIAISAFNGQFDSFAILPGIVAVSAWRELAPPRRAPAAGLLIGLGAAIKTFPLLLVLALLPSCRSRREASVLLGCALGLFAISLGPWLVEDHHALLTALQYRSLAGQGGISLVVQPDLAGLWLGGPVHRLSGLSSALQDGLGTAVALTALAVAAAVLMRSKAEPVRGTILLWAVAFAFGINFSPRYAVWLLPFMLMAGEIALAWALQALLIVPTVLLLAAPFSDHGVIYAYVPLMLGAWLVFAWAAVALARRLLTQTHR
jgi:hypothetical protein